MCWRVVSERQSEACACSMPLTTTSRVWGMTHNAHTLLPEILPTLFAYGPAAARRQTKKHHNVIDNIHLASLQPL